MPYQKGDIIKQTRNPGPTFVVIGVRTVDPDPANGRVEAVEVVDAINVNENEVVELWVDATEPAEV